MASEEACSFLELLLLPWLHLIELGARRLHDLLEVLVAQVLLLLARIDARSVTSLEIFIRNLMRTRLFEVCGRGRGGGLSDALRSGTTSGGLAARAAASLASYGSTN